MDCKEFRELLDLYFDGELSPEATLAARAHLEECVPCSRAERQLVLLQSRLKRVVSESEPPPVLVHNVRRLAQPVWAWLVPVLFKRPLTRREGEVTESSFWHRKITVPAPAFALLLIAIAALGGWVIARRSTAPAASLDAIKQPAPRLSTSLAPKGFDLTQFDRGERPAIYKVRLMDYRTPGR